MQGLACRPLAEEALLLSGPDPAGAVPCERVDGQPTVRFDVAAALPLVLQSPRYAIRQTVERIAAEHGIALNVVHEHDSTRVIRSLYLAGAGFTFTPASPAIVRRINEVLRAALARPEVRASIDAQGATPAPSSSEEYADAMRAEIALTARMMKAARLAAQ